MRSCTTISKLNKSLSQLRQSQRYHQKASFSSLITTSSFRQNKKSHFALLPLRHNDNIIPASSYSEKYTTERSVNPSVLSSPQNQIRLKSSSAAIDDSSTTTTIPFLLADIGEGIAEVEILQWFISPGDTISQFDAVCQVQSDKATVDITSRYDGVVMSLEGDVGDMINVGSPLIYIDVDNGDDGNDGHEESGGKEEAAGDLNDTLGHAEESSAKLHNVDEAQDRLSIPTTPTKFDLPPSSSSSNAKHLATPAVRKLAKENSIDLSSVVGTGPKGRILKSDLLNLLKQTTKTSKSEEEEATKAVEKYHHHHHQQQQQQEEEDAEKEIIVPIRGYQRLMIKSMESSLTIPHMTYSDEVNMTSLKLFRRSLQQKKQKISYLPFMIKAASLSMKEYPTLNSTFISREKEGGEVEYELVQRKSHDIGIAMDSPRGLVVPVVRGCQGKSVLEIKEDLLRLQSLANEGTLTERDIQNPTFTLSNIGSIGGTYMSPIVVPPTVAIGAMGKIRRLPRFIDENSNEVEAVDVMQISWGGDHRVIDGATMAKFSNLWKDYLEDPLSMLLYMK